MTDVCYTVAAETYNTGGAFFKRPSLYLFSHNQIGCAQNAPGHGGINVPAVRLSNDGTRGQERFVMGEKRCTKCGEVKPLEEFNRAKGGKNGLASQCRTCKKIARQAWGVKNQEHVREYAHDYYVIKSKPHNSQRYAKYRTCYQKYSHEYYWTHREECIARNRAWKADHREHLQEHERNRWLNKRRYMSEKNRRWRAEHSLQRAQVQAKRRARTTKRVDYAAILQHDGWICHICGDFVTRETLSFDHVIPLAKGGKHIASNIKVAHRSCNSKKGTKLL